MEENAGTRFGNYELVKRIDVGGMGEVYLAHQLTAFGRRVAIKIIRSDLAHDITARARFLREAEVSAHLKHEHILPLFDFGEVEGRLFLVTPYIEGGTLAKLLKDNGTITLQEAHTFFVALVQAIAYIHRRGVIHRDLKPTNIMLDREDGEVYVRLIDFGIASLQGQSASPPLTTAGHEMGTVAYMAPERLSGIAAPSNDIFSLGVMLHQMLTGRMPTVSPSPSSLAPRLPEPLTKVVRRCIAPNPAERYATAEELLKAFEQAYQQVIQPPPSQSPAPPPVSSKPVMTPMPELVALAHSGEVSALASAARPAGPLHFAPEDYSAPTTAFQSPPLYPHQPPPVVSSQKRLAGTKKKSSLLVVVSSASIVVLLLLAGMLYYGYEVVAAASVSVSFTPRSQVISQVFTFKAIPTTSAVNFTQATVPARIFTVSHTAHQTRGTTGQNCGFLPVDCQQVVSPDDVNNLAAQIQPGLESSIKQELQTKMSGAHGTQVSDVQFSVPVITADPPEGSVSKTVTVTLVEQGNMSYASNADVASLVHHLLAAATGQGYQVVEATVNIGQAAIQSFDPTSGVSTMEVAAGAVTRYQFSPAQLQQFSLALKGRSRAEAEAFLKRQPGIDPASIHIQFSAGSGQTMPSDPQHIKFIPTDPANQSGVSLTPVTVQTPTNASPPTLPTDTTTPSPTPTDNGGGGGG